MLQNEDQAVKRLFIPPQNGYPEATMYTPDQVSEYGFDKDKSRYVSVCLETEAGSELYFMEVMADINDDSRIVGLPGRTLPTETGLLFHLEGDNVTSIGTERNTGPMWDFLSSTTGFEPSDGKHVRYDKKLTGKMVEYYYEAFSTGNDKMFPKNRFGVTASVGTDLPRIGVGAKNQSYGVGVLRRGIFQIRSWRQLVFSAGNHLFSLLRLFKPGSSFI